MWYFFLPHLRFCILFRVCLMWYRRNHFVWTAIKRVDGIRRFVSQFCFLSFYLCFLWYSNLISGVFFSHFHSNRDYLNDRHLKIIQFKSHFLAEIGNVDTFMCACCCSRSRCSSHFNKRAQCPENQIVWLSFASPSKMCVCVYASMKAFQQDLKIRKQQKRHQKTC